MLRAIGHSLLFLAMFSIIGGHWAVLQSVAWTGMLLEYSKDSSVSTALIKTFGGKDPCQMCRTIEEGRQKETRLPASLKADKKIEVFLAAKLPTELLPPSEDFFYPPLSDDFAPGRFASPPSPVPIAA